MTTDGETAAASGTRVTRQSDALHVQTADAAKVITAYLVTAPEQGDWPWEDHCDGLAGGIIVALRAAGMQVVFQGGSRRPAGRTRVDDLLTPEETALFLEESRTIRRAWATIRQARMRRGLRIADTDSRPL